MTALAQMSDEVSPTVWTVELVQARLVDAFDVERRIPGQGTRRLASSWPAAPLHTFEDMLHWDDARKRVWEDWSRAKGVFSWEISRMDEALNWLRLLKGDELVHLQAWAHCKANHRPVRRMLQKRGLSRTTFYRTVDRAAQRIADRLNERGVMVR